MAAQAQKTPAEVIRGEGARRSARKMTNAVPIHNRFGQVRTGVGCRVVQAS